MTSLYYVTEHIKMLGKWLGIIIGSAIILVFLFRFIVFLKEVIAPTPPPPPTMIWGKLPDLILPQSSFTQKFTYTVNTISGDLPNLPNHAPVYLIATPEASLQSLNNAGTLVGNVGFDQEGIRISETAYQWTNPKPPIQKMQYDIVTKNFDLSSDFLSDSNIVSGKNLSSDTTATEKAEDFLANLDAFPSDLDATKSAISFFAIQNSALVPTTSLSNAQIIQIDFFQKNIDNFSIYYPEYPASPMTVFVGGGDFDETVVSVHYYHNTLTDISSTYPIYTTHEALTLLQKGKGYVASYKGISSSILIQNVKLGFYLAKDSKTYMMPIFIFEGSNNFVAFVSAVKEK